MESNKVNKNNYEKVRTTAPPLTCRRLRLAFESSSPAIATLTESYSVSNYKTDSLQAKA